MADLSALSIKPLRAADGLEYYVMFASGFVVRHIHGEKAAAKAAQIWAGHNWRRIKREMARARREGLDQYVISHPNWQRHG